MRLWNLSHPSSTDIPVSDHSRDTRSLQKQNPIRTPLDLCLCFAAQLFIHLSLETHPVRQPWFAAPKQYTQMLEQVKAYDDVLGHYLKGLSVTKVAEQTRSDRSVHQHYLEDSQAQDLLWVVTIGACFGEEIWTRQPRLQSPNSIVIAKVAGFWDKEESNTTQRADGDSDMTQTEKQSQWASRRFGVLIRHLGYTRLTDVRELFTTKYAYDAMIMDATLNKLFDLNQK
jgi:hypothetical protein